MEIRPQRHTDMHLRQYQFVLNYKPTLVYLYLITVPRRLGWGDTMMMMMIINDLPSQRRHYKALGCGLERCPSLL